MHDALGVPDPDIFTAEQSEADKGLLVKFHTKSVLLKSESAAAGRPIHRDRTYIDILVPGNKVDKISRPATPRDLQRFPRHYEAFQKRVEVPEEGTPLAEWPIMSRSQVDELAYFNIKTVEQLANVSDANTPGLMGINSLKQKAKDFLASASNPVEAAKLKEELAARDEIIAGLQAQMDTLLKKVTASEGLKSELDDDEAQEPVAATTRKRRSRPKAEEE